MPAEIANLITANVPRLCDERNSLTLCFRLNECNKLEWWFKVAEYPLIAKPLLGDLSNPNTTCQLNIFLIISQLVILILQNLFSRLTSKFVWLPFKIILFHFWFIFQQIFILIFCQTNSSFLLQSNFELISFKSWQAKHI